MTRKCFEKGITAIFYGEETVTLAKENWTGTETVTNTNTTMSVSSIYCPNRQHCHSSNIRTTPNDDLNYMNDGAEIINKITITGNFASASFYPVLLIPTDIRQRGEKTCRQFSTGNDISSNSYITLWEHMLFGDSFLTVDKPISSTTTILLIHMWVANWARNIPHTNRRHLQPFQIRFVLVRVFTRELMQRLCGRVKWWLVSWLCETKHQVTYE